MTRTRVLLLSGAGLLGWGCGETRLDAGSNTSGPMPSAGDASAQLESELWPDGMPSNSFDLPCAPPAPDGYGGTWTGQFGVNACVCNTSRLDPEDPNPIHGCTINDPEFGETRFDLAVSGDTLSGSLVLPEGVETLHT